MMIILAIIMIERGNLIYFQQKNTKIMHNHDFKTIIIMVTTIIYLLLLQFLLIESIACHRLNLITLINVDQLSVKLQYSNQQQNWKERTLCLVFWTPQKTMMKIYLALKDWNRYERAQSIRKIQAKAIKVEKIMEVQYSNRENKRISQGPLNLYILTKIKILVKSSQW